MKTFVVLAGLLLLFLFPDYVSAQLDDILGPQCNSKSSNTLIIPSIRQPVGTSWCWAAAAQMVMGFHDQKFRPPGTELCQIVKTVLLDFESQDLPCCPGPPPYNECTGEPGLPEDVLNVPEYKFTYDPLSEGWKNLNWTEATSEICQNRPFISMIDYLFGDAHLVVVHAYRIKNGKKELRVYDPIEGDWGFLAYDEFYGQNPDYIHRGDTFGILPTP